MISDDTGGKQIQEDASMEPVSPQKDEDALLDAALEEVDERLVRSLRAEDRKRKGNLWLVAAGLFVAALSLITVGMLSLTGFTPTESDKVLMALKNGWELHEEGQYSQAELQFKSATEINSSSVEAWNGLGWSLLNQQEYDKAEKAFLKAQELAPNHPAVNNGLGYVYFMRKEFDRSEVYWRRAAPQSDAAWYGLAKLYLLTGEFEKARPWAEKVAAQNPDSWLGEAMMEAVEQKRLHRRLRRQIEPFDENEHAPSVKHGWSLLSRGLSQEAATVFRNVLKDDPDRFGAHNGLGFALLNLGEVAEAKEHFETCLKMEPESSGPMNGLARCLKAEGKIQEAIELWERMVKLYPVPNAGTSGLAWAYLELGEYEKSLQHFEDLVRENPDDTYSQDGLERARKGLEKSNS